MTKELSIENIKNELMDALVGDMRIITAFTTDKEKRKATDYIGTNIFNYLEDNVNSISKVDTYIHFDVMKDVDNYDVFIQLKTHRDNVLYKNNNGANCLDEISKYIEEIVNELYPYYKRYTDVPGGCIDRFVSRIIKFRLSKYDAKRYAEKCQKYSEDKVSE